jgi:transcriptional regulator with XRE-family HTH domain
MEKHAMDMVFNAELFWEDVRAARTARRLSQKTVGREFGVGGSAVGQWERSKRTPSAVKFLALCTAFELEPSVYGTLISFPAWANKNMFDREKLKSMSRGKKKDYVPLAEAVDNSRRKIVWGYDGEWWYEDELPNDHFRRSREEQREVE